MYSADVEHSLSRYLVDVLGLSTKMAPWGQESTLPIYLQGTYDFLQAKLYNLPCLFMIATDEQEQTPAVARKQMEKIKEWWEGEVVYVRRNISAYNRKRLIDRRVSFIVPQKQMYLPLLGIDLREHFQKIRSERKQLSPAAQAVLIFALLEEHAPGYTVAELAERLSYSSMALIRVLDELRFAGIGTSSFEGRKRILKFPLKTRQLWDTARKFMRDPVKKCVLVSDITNEEYFVVSGLSALAKCSLLTSPMQETYAISSKNWKMLNEREEMLQVPRIEDRAMRIEIWWYDPATLAEKGTVDPFSLYLSLLGSKDERVQIALDEMLEKHLW